MKPIEECTIGIVGLGLMGGAVAMALRHCGAASPDHLIACDKDEETLALALAQGVIDEGFATPGEIVKRSDFIFLCLNPSTLLKFWESWAAFFKSGALITDIAGIKVNIVAALEKNLRPDLDFIPGHPMAGSEKGGFANAGHCNFKGKNYILTPLKRNKPENLEFVKNLLYRMGFGRITETTPEEHDRKIAFTSQLCHVIAAALIDCEQDTQITRFGGGSFEDLTRIAMLNASMWSEIFIENKSELIKRIEQFEGSLDALKALIANGSAHELEARLGAVRERRTIMKG
ncbi:prephenate dehydrogenase [Leadbettera azotonutricia]|uniref:Prephenate dehydrogenase n=1 Tax=Leadbettera azotonutricia (strain ATCC BAA-888 / DSM 13862 / ZAS-9) TaxID=545695 RepID=F5YFM1_LEAAZ|nr:prephenate dehydrogenase [Leadbettera azotonutricia]AEF83301.1 prephenate dehydrogenase [Leadbettera azotonutricia ZAS-9]